MGEKIARIRCAGCHRSGLVSWADAESERSAPLHLSRGFKYLNSEQNTPALVCETCGRVADIISFA